MPRYLQVYSDGLAGVARPPPPTINIITNDSLKVIQPSNIARGGTIGRVGGVEEICRF